MRNISAILFLLYAIPLYVAAQERTVNIDFESGSFINNPQIPSAAPFAIRGEAGKEIEMVKVNIYKENKNQILNEFIWNRYPTNTTETFSIVIPAILRSNSKYDFEVITYKLLSDTQKQALLTEIEKRVQFFLKNNLYFDGKNVSINKPKDVYQKLQTLINESLIYQESKNSIDNVAPSSLVLNELQKQNEYRFGRFLRRKSNVQRDSIANDMVTKKVDHLTNLILSELTPYVNTQLVQHYRKVKVISVETDKEPFSLPVNIGMYAWEKNVNINNTSLNNIDFTPGAGITIPFYNKSKLAYQKRMFDSFGFSAGVLFRPIVDKSGTEFVTPGVNLPMYTGLGIRVFKVIRINAGVLILGEKGNEGFNNLSVIPTAGLALELNIWMGIKK